MDSLKAYDKIDNTLCLNRNMGKLSFNLDTDEHIDCENTYEMIDCLESIKTDLVAYHKLVKPSAAKTPLKVQFCDEIGDCRGCPVFHSKMLCEIARNSTDSIRDTLRHLDKELTKVKNKYDL